MFLRVLRNERIPNLQIRLGRVLNVNCAEVVQRHQVEENIRLKRMHTDRAPLLTVESGSCDEPRGHMCRLNMNCALGAATGYIYDCPSDGLRLTSTFFRHELPDQVNFHCSHGRRASFRPTRSLVYSLNLSEDASSPYQAAQVLKTRCRSSMTPSSTRRWSHRSPLSRQTPNLQSMMWQADVRDSQKSSQRSYPSYQTFRV